VCDPCPLFGLLIPKSNIELIEKVQRRFTKRLEGLSELSYNDRLKSLNLERLEQEAKLSLG